MRKNLIEAVEKHFGTVEPVPSGHTLEFLSDNSSACIAVQTHQTTRVLGLKPINAPVCSPQSDDMTETHLPMRFVAIT